MARTGRGYARRMYKHRGLSDFMAACSPQDEVLKRHGVGCRLRNGSVLAGRLVGFVRVHAFVFGLNAFEQDTEIASIYCA